MDLDLDEILAKATRLDSRSKDRALEYLSNTLRPLAATHYTEIDDVLMSIKLHHVSTNSIMGLLTLAYYWRAFLPSWLAFNARVYQELVVARGETDLAEALDALV